MTTVSVEIGANTLPARLVGGYRLMVVTESAHSLTKVHSLSIINTTREMLCFNTVVYPTCKTLPLRILLSFWEFTL